MNKKSKANNGGFSIVEAVKNFLFEQKNAPKDYKSKPSIKPSELSSPCLRKNFYTYYRTESSFPWEADNIADFEAGDAFHKIVRTWLKNAGFLVENLDKRTRKIPISFIDGKPDPEFVVKDNDLWIRWAKADGLVRVDEGDKQGVWVLEVKSKNEDKFDKVEDPGRDRYQGMLYAYLLEEQLKRGDLAHIPLLEDVETIRGVLYIYVNRNRASEMKEFWEEKDPVFFQDEILSKVVQLQDYVKKHELPPKTQDFCKWCSYRDKCEKNWIPEKKDPEF